MIVLDNFDIAVIMVSVICMATAGIFGSYYGLLYGNSKSLCEAKVGEVYNFEYLQPLKGDPERFLAKVISPVCTLDNDAINRINRRSNYRKNDPKFMRTNHLVTCKTRNGEVRQFYCERAINCRKPLLGKLFV